MDTQKIDWTQPIETNEGILVESGEPDSVGERFVRWIDKDGDSRNHWFSADGRSNVGGHDFLRNVSPATPTRTALEQRMEDEWRNLAKVDPNDVGPHFAANWVETARSIVAEIGNPDRTEARRLAEIWTISEDAAYEILSRGRALERGE